MSPSYTGLKMISNAAIRDVGWGEIRNGPIWNGLPDQGIPAGQLLAVLGESPGILRGFERRRAHEIDHPAARPPAGNDGYVEARIVQLAGI